MSRPDANQVGAAADVYAAAVVQTRCVGRIGGDQPHGGGKVEQFLLLQQEDGLQEVERDVVGGEDIQKLGNAARVATIDKLSVVSVSVVAVLFLGSVCRSKTGSAS